MKIVVTNQKGGMGKSTIAKALALEFNTGIITNEPNTDYEAGLTGYNLVEIRPNEPFPDIGQNIDAVYDLGGYLDNRIAELLPNADVIVIPLKYRTWENDWKKTLAWIEEVKTYNQNIIFVINDTINQKPDELYQDQIHQACTELYPNIPCVILPPSTCMTRMHETGIGILQLADNNPPQGKGLFKSTHKKFLTGFEQLVELCKTKGVSQ